MRVRDSIATQGTRRSGFTLMELLLVMAILVVLLTLAVPRFLGTRKKANIDLARSQVGLFKSPLEMYAMDLNTYPNTEQGLKALYECPEDLEKKEQWKGPYLDAEPPQDPWLHDYQYEYPPTKNKKDFPDIWSLGPDGEDGTEDDIVNWTEEDKEEGESP